MTQLNDEQYDKNYSDFFNHFWKKFSQLSWKKKDDMCEFWFKEFIKNIENRLTKEQLNEYHMNDIYRIWLLSDENFKKELNEDKYIERFWMWFVRFNEDVKNRILKFEYEEFIKKCEERNLDVDNTFLWNLIDFIEMKDEEFKYEIEHNKFKEEFWMKSFGWSKELRDKLIKFWYDNFMRICKEKNLDIKKFKLKELYHYVIDSNNDWEYDKQYQKFFNKYWTKFSLSKKEIKKEAINLWFENLIDISKKRKITINDFYNFQTFLKFIKMNEEEFRYEYNYLLFNREFSWRFTSYTKETIDWLIEYWFDKFINKCKEKNFDTSKRLNFLLSCVKNEELYKQDEDYQRFFNKFWISYTLTNSELVDKTKELWFDEFMKIYEKNEYRLNSEMTFSQIFDAVMKSKEKYEYDNEYDKFHDLFWTSFGLLNEDKRDKMIKLWFNDFMKILKERFWDFDNWKNINFYYDICMKWNEELIYDKNKRLFMDEYWFSFSNINKDLREAAINFWFNEFHEFMKKNSINLNDWVFKISDVIKLLWIKDSAKLKKIVELNKFKDKLPNKINKYTSEDIINEAIEFWFDNFMKVLNDRKIDTRFISFEWIFDMIKMNDVEFNDSLKEKEFYNIFWKNFSLLRRDRKDELLKIWLKEFLNRLTKRLWNDFLKENFIFIIEIWMKNDSEYSLYLEEKKFIKKYWKMFSTSNDDLKISLLKIWFNEFEKILKDRNLSINDYFIRELYELSILNERDFKRAIDERKFRDFFKKQNRVIKSRDMMEKLLDIWFDKFIDKKERICQN